MGNGELTELWVREKLADHTGKINGLREFKSAQEERDKAVTARLGSIEKVLWFIGTTTVLTLVAVVVNLTIGG